MISGIFNRTIFFEGDLSNSSKILLNKIGFRTEVINNHQNYSAVNDTLYYDRRALNNLYKITNQGENVDSISNALISLTFIESELGLSLISDYKFKRVANDYKHGVAHTIRVMFWVLFLSYELISIDRFALGEEEIAATLYAAFIHDLCRANDKTDENHGKAAAKKFAKHLSGLLSQPYLDRCLNAVEVHSKESDPDNEDLIWKLLKDADAIDRSRFAPPEKKNGCQMKYLRLEFLKEDSVYTSNLLWASYYLSRATKYVNWTEDACIDFVKIFLASLSSISNSMRLHYDLHDFTKKIINKTMKAL